MVRKTNNSMAVVFDMVAPTTSTKRDGSPDDALSTPGAISSEASVKKAPSKTIAVAETPNKKTPVNKAASNKVPITKTLTKATASTQTEVKKSVTSPNPSETVVKKSPAQQATTKSIAAVPSTTKKFSKATGREIKPWGAQKIRKKSSKSDDTDQVSDKEKVFNLWLKEQEGSDSDDDKPLASFRKTTPTSSKPTTSSSTVPGNATVLTPVKRKDVPADLTTPPTTPRKTPTKQSQVKNAGTPKTPVRALVHETQISKAQARKTPSPTAPVPKILPPKPSKATGRKPEPWTASKIRKRPVKSDVDDFSLWLSQQDSNGEDTTPRTKTHAKQDDLTVNTMMTPASTPDIAAVKSKQPVPSSKTPTKDEKHRANTLLSPAPTPEKTPTKQTPVMALGKKTVAKKTPVVKGAYRVTKTKTPKKTGPGFTTNVKSENKKPRSSTATKDGQGSSALIKSDNVVPAAADIGHSTEDDVTMADTNCIISSVKDDITETDSVLPSVEDDTTMGRYDDSIVPDVEQHLVPGPDSVLPTTEEDVVTSTEHVDFAPVRGGTSMTTDVRPTPIKATAKKDPKATKPKAARTRKEESIVPKDNMPSAAGKAPATTSTTSPYDKLLLVSVASYDLHYPTASSPVNDEDDGFTPYLVESTTPLSPGESYAYMTIADSPHIRLEVDDNDNDSASASFHGAASSSSSSSSSSSARPATLDDIPFTLADEATLADYAELGGRPLLTLTAEEQHRRREEDKKEEGQEGRTVINLTLEVDEQVAELMAARSRKRKADELEAEERKVRGEEIVRRVKRARMLVAKPAVRSDILTAVDVSRRLGRQRTRGWEERWCFPDSDGEDDDDDEDLAGIGKEVRGGADYALDSSDGEDGPADEERDGSWVEDSDGEDCDRDDEMEAAETAVQKKKKKTKKCWQERLFFPDSDPEESEEE